MTQRQPETRDSLMVEHRDAIKRRAAAPLGGHEYEQAAEAVARIEIEIARIEEPPVELLGKRQETPPRP